MTTSTLTGVLLFHSETGTEGGWYAFQDSKFMGSDGMWSRDGFHMLKNGDRLKIWRTDRTAVIWEGEVRLIELERFEHSVEGMWVNQMPADSMEQFRGEKGQLAWGRMFLMELPAELTPKAGD